MVNKYKFRKYESKNDQKIHHVHVTRLPLHIKCPKVNFNFSMSVYIVLNLYLLHNLIYLLIPSLYVLRVKYMISTEL